MSGMTHESKHGNRFRRMALGLRDAVEGAHMGHPDFRVNGRIFASLYGGRGTVKLTPEQQAECMRDGPAAFSPASGAWGRQGWTTVRLDSVDEATLGESLTLAWQNAVRQKPSRTRSRSARGRRR
jgi:hypothetical protein